MANEIVSAESDSNLELWGTYEVDAALEEQDILASLSTSSFLKLKVGRNVVRFLPPRRGETTPFKMRHQHYVELPGMEKGVSFNCPRMMAKRYCPLCARANELRATGNPADYDLAGDLLPRFQVLGNVIDRADEDKGPQTLTFGKKIHELLTQLRADPDTGGDFTHPIRGYDVVITRTGTKKNDTKYTTLPSRNITAIGDLAILATAPDLSRLITVPTDAEIAEKVSLIPSGGAAPAPRSVTAGRQAAGALTSGRRRTAEDDMQDRT